MAAGLPAVCVCVKLPINVRLNSKYSTCCLKPLNTSTSPWRKADFILWRRCPSCRHTSLQSCWGIQPLLSQCSPPSSPDTWWATRRSQTPCTASLRSRSCVWAACILQCTWTPGSLLAQWSSTVSRWERGSWWSTSPCSRCLCCCWHHSHHENWGKERMEEISWVMWQKGRKKGPRLS